MMAVDLRIFLVGHIALVRLKAGELVIVLPKAKHDDHGQHQHQEHYPLLVYECKNTDNRCDFPAGLPPRVLARDQRFGVILLDGQEISVTGVEVEQDGLEFPDGSTGNQPTSDDKHFFSWVSSMRKVTGGSGKIKQSILRDANEVAGVLEIKGVRGSATTFGFVDAVLDQQARIVSFDFKDENGQNPVPNLERAMADNVLVSLSLTADEATFDFKLLHQTNEIAPLKLKSHDQDGTIDIVLANLPELLAGCEPPVKGPHFEHFFKHLLNGGSPKKIPFLKDRGPLKKDIEGALDQQPLVLRYVEGEDGPCFMWLSLKEISPFGLSNRPICPLTVYDEP